MFVRLGSDLNDLDDLGIMKMRSSNGFKSISVPLEAQVHLAAGDSAVDHAMFQQPPLKQQQRSFTKSVAGLSLATLYYIYMLV